MGRRLRRSLATILLGAGLTGSAALAAYDNLAKHEFERTQTVETMTQVREETPAITYTVNEGDWLSSIRQAAIANNTIDESVTVDSIQQWSDIKNKDLIYPQQIVTLRPATEELVDNQSYTTITVHEQTPVPDSKPRDLTTLMLLGLGLVGARTQRRTKYQPLPNDHENAASRDLGTSMWRLKGTMPLEHQEPVVETLTIDDYIPRYARATSGAPHESTTPVHERARFVADLVSNLKNPTRRDASIRMLEELGLRRENIVQHMLHDWTFVQGQTKQNEWNKLLLETMDEQGRIEYVHGVLKQIQIQAKVDAGFAEACLAEDNTDALLYAHKQQTARKPIPDMEIPRIAYTVCAPTPRYARPKRTLRAAAMRAAAAVAFITTLSGVPATTQEPPARLEDIITTPYTPATPDITLTVAADGTRIARVAAQRTATYAPAESTNTKAQATQTSETPYVSEPVNTQPTPSYYATRRGIEADMRESGIRVADIATSMGLSTSTIYRDLKRNHK